MDTTASPVYQEDPVSPVTAMTTWIYLYLAAVIQSRASVCGVAKATAEWLVTAALKASMETLSQQKTAYVSNQIYYILF